jgi:hypothetical protein
MPFLDSRGGSGSARSPHITLSTSTAMADNQGPKPRRLRPRPVIAQSRSSNSAPGTRFRALRRTVAALIHLAMSASCQSASLQTFDPSPEVPVTREMPAPPTRLPVRPPSPKSPLYTVAPAPGPFSSDLSIALVRRCRHCVFYHQIGLARLRHRRVLDHQHRFAAANKGHRPG